jgi:hypothetical protein
MIFFIQNMKKNYKLVLFFKLFSSERISGLAACRHNLVNVFIKSYYFVPG